MVEAIVDKMLEFGETQLLNIGRGSWLQPFSEHREADIGPLWAYNGPLPPVEELRKGGMVCVGLLSVLLRHVGQELPFLNKANYLAYPKGEDPYKDNTWHSPWNEGITFGYGGADEWMYIYHYVKGTLQKFDVNGKYPKGTLLFRVFSPYDGGHVAILREDSSKKPLLDCTVLHTGGDSAGESKVTMHETVRRTHEMYSRGKSYNWDPEGEFEVKFFDKNGNPFPYYTHVLLPKDYLDVTDEGSLTAMNRNTGRESMFSSRLIF